MQYQNFYTAVSVYCQKISLPILLGILLVPSKNFSQATNISREDKSKLALTRAINTYDQYIGRNAMIYTGNSYFDAYEGILNHQFFVVDYWEFGSVNYDNYSYDSIFLMYDIYQDLLLIENFNSDGFLSPIKLYSPKVSSFRLHGFDFIRLEKDTISNIKEGFYNLMYDGDNLQVLVKRRKEIVNANEINSVREEFIERDRYYIQKYGIYYQVRKRGSILKVLNDHKKEVKAFIRKNNFIFKINPETQMVEVVKYYDSLN